MRSAVAALGLVLAGWPLAAVGQTAIVPDTAPGRALGSTVSPTGTAFTIDGGTRAGANLFHSFARFDLAAGDTARWARAAGDGAQIANVVNRVTGGTPSHISGTLDSTALPNAAFYFVNPAGIVFGPGAQVNVPSAAYFSTAAELRFADGARFAAATPDGSTLSLAAPESFGFVGGQGAIAMSGLSPTFAPAAARLSFSAADVNVADSQFGARGVDLIAVGDQATALRLADPLSAAQGGRVSVNRSNLAALTVDAPGAPLRVSGGEVRIAAGNVVSDSAGAGRGGDLVLQGGLVTLAPDAAVISSARGAGAGGDLSVRAGSIVVDAGGASTTTGFAAVASAGGAAGDVRLDAETVQLVGEADNPRGVGSALVGSFSLAAGSAGDITLNASRLVIDFGQVSSFSQGGGDGGDVRVVAARQELGAADVQTGAFGGGRAGDVRIEGDVIAVSGGFFGAAPGGGQQSGALVVTATTSLEALGGTFAAVSASPDAAGDITLKAPRILLTRSRIDTQALGEGLVGQVLVDADTLLLDRVDIAADAANGPRDTGLVRLRATGDLVMFQGVYSSTATGIADGGRIEISGRNVQLVGALVQTDTGGFATGDAGKVAITAADALSLDNAVISSSSRGQGRGGDVSLSARTMRIANASAVLSESNVEGDAGGIEIVAGDSLRLEDASVSSRLVSGTGNAGSVTIDAGGLFMADAAVSSDSRAAGRAGKIDVRATTIDLDGRGREATGFSSDALSLGAAGAVTIQAKSITLRNLAYVTSLGVGEGDAGDIAIRAGELSLLRGGNISSVANNGAGGDISIVADRMLVQSEPGLPSFVAAASFGEGDAGNLSLGVGALVMDGGAFSSDTFVGAGDAGQLRIEADTITLKNQASISSSTNAFGDAGSVVVAARTLSLDSGSLILSVATSFADGDARSVSVAADTIVVGKDSSITAATFGRGDAGSVDIVARSLRLDGGEVSSSAGVGATGAARDVRIVAADDLTLVNGGIVSTLSDNTIKAGTITIDAGRLTVEGLRSAISSENIADAPGDAGAIFITAGGLRVADGARISTNAVAGAAGDIRIDVLRPGLVVLRGGEARGAISTSSGPGTGGRITLTDPLAIISDGGAILALGQQRGANVTLRSRYFIKAADLGDPVSVDGDLDVQVPVYDVASGTVSRDLSVLDASKVLRGQCPAARSTGAVSQLITRPVGPYAREPLTLGPAPAIAGGACP